MYKNRTNQHIPEQYKLTHTIPEENKPTHTRPELHKLTHTRPEENKPTHTRPEQTAQTNTYQNRIHQHIPEQNTKHKTHINTPTSNSLSRPLSLYLYLSFFLVPVPTYQLTLINLFISSTALSFCPNVHQHFTQI